MVMMTHKRWNLYPFLGIQINRQVITLTLPGWDTSPLQLLFFILMDLNNLDKVLCQKANHFTSRAHCGI